MAVRTLPRDPPGEGGAKTKIKKQFEHSQVLVRRFGVAGTRVRPRERERERERERDRETERIA